MKFVIEDVLQGETVESMKNIIESVKACYLYNEMLKHVRQRACRNICNNLSSCKNFFLQ